MLITMIYNVGESGGAFRGGLAGCRRSLWRLLRRGAVEWEPVGVGVGWRGFAGVAGHEWNDEGAEECDGVGVELGFEGLLELVLVAGLGEHAVEGGEGLGASAAAALGASVWVAAGAWLEHGERRG